MTPITAFKRSLLLVWMVWMSAPAVSAQDSHYWTHQFGNRARLLGGSVIGSATDLSAIYYNPGFIAWIEEPELLLSGTVFQYTRLQIKDALGPQGNLENGRFSLSPSLFAGEIRSEALGDNRIAYAVLTRQESEFRINERANVTNLFQSVLPELSFASAGAQLDTRLSEYWIGGSWSRKVSEHLAIGASPFFVVRNHRLSTQVLTQALAGNEGGIDIIARDFDYQHWRLLAKIGLATEVGKWQLGVTMTTPSAGLFGSGTVGFDDSHVVTDDGATVESDFQKDVSASYKSPLSIGFGGARTFGYSRVHVGAEWFNRVSERTIMEPAPYQSPSSGREFKNQVTYAADPVFNVAVGVENRRKNDLQLFASFRTDFSSAPSQSISNSNFSTYDLFHLAGGATFKVEQSEFTVGIVYAFGGSDVGENNAGFAPDLDVRFRKLTFIVGFSLVLP